MESDAAANVDSAYKSRRDMLQEYVKNVQPEFMERFVQKAPAQVVEAMRQTVTNMLGTLPPQFFDIHVSTVSFVLHDYHLTFSKLSSEMDIFCYKVFCNSCLRLRGTSHE